jgi:DNA-binding NarL/FixJ family response regulator
VRVAIAEDSLLLREGVARLLREAGMDVVAECGNADELLSHIRSHPVDVAIVDIRLPPTHSDEGLRAALEIRSANPGVGVLVLSQYVELGLAMKLLADSADGVGYLLKTGSATSRSSSRPCSASPAVVRRSTRSSCPRSFHDVEKTIRWSS